VICCQFIFRPAAYDDEFHRLDGQIDQYARSLPGFVRAETWVAAEGGTVNAIYLLRRQAVGRPAGPTHDLAGRPCD
jgi:hypothetical protein